jgi:hypothetical protein
MVAQADPPEPATVRRLSPRQERAAQLVAAGLTLRAAAEQVGAGERSVQRWYATPAFRERVRQLQSEACGRIHACLLSCAGEAVVRLVKLLDSSNPAVSLGAAKEILAHLPPPSNPGQQGGGQVVLNIVQQTITAPTVAPAVLPSYEVVPSDGNGASSPGSGRLPGE